MKAPCVPSAHARRGALARGRVPLTLCAGLAVWLLLAPLFSGRSDPRPLTLCPSRAKQLASALKLYAADYDGALPPASVWADASAPYVRNNAAYRCDARPGLPSGYAFNLPLDRALIASVAHPDRQPVFFESTLGRWNGADTPRSFAAPHRGRGVVGYLDGHAKPQSVAPAADAGLRR